MALKVSLVVFFCSLSTAFCQPVPALANRTISEAGIDRSRVNQALARKIASLVDQLPPSTRHYVDFTESELGERIRQNQNYEILLREKLQDNWFAALVGTNPEEALVIKGRFETWSGFIDFLQQKAALVEVWAYPEKGANPPRRIPALELAQLKRQPREQPCFVTLTFRDGNSGELVKYRVEFGFKAADFALNADRAYFRHRQLQRVVQKILSTRDPDGRTSAIAQWQALRAAVDDGQLNLVEIPLKPLIVGNPFVAAEYEVDDANNFLRVVRFYRETEIRKRIIYDSDGHAHQLLELRKDGEARPREAMGYRMKGVSDRLEAVPSPILGQDIVDLRIKNPSEPDVRRWPVLEFGEPEILNQSALAKFALISAHLDKQRKAVAVKRSNYDLIAEPIIAALNIGGGLAGWGFPAGDAGRLFYNLINSQLIQDVPRVKELRNLFALFAARDKRPDLRTRPAQFLSKEDIRRLEQEGRKLSDREVQDYLERIDDSDLEAMIRLARMQMFDARITNFLNILTSAGKVSGLTESGILRDIFNSPYFSLNGDINLSTILLVAIGQKDMTPLSGVSLEDLSQGEGPAKAWVQYFNVSLDVRALVNTVVRLSKRTLAQKELEKPFPYAPRATDLTAYEIRIFGFPLFLFYKRGLIRADYEAFQQDYAYGILGPNSYGFQGSRIVERFATKEEMDGEIRAGRMFPLGYVKVPDGKGGWKETNLAVFAHRIPQGKHRNKIAIIIYGLRAFAEHSQYMDRELLRFHQFERALQEGAVIERLVQAENPSGIARAEFEPKLIPGSTANREIYAPLLGNLLELHRSLQRKTWGLPLEAEDAEALSRVMRALADQGVVVENSEEDPLLGVDKYNSTFLYRKRVDGKWRVMQMTSIAGLEDISRDLQKAEEGQQLEQFRREVASAKLDGIAFLNSMIQINGRSEIGPLLADENNRVFGTGIRIGSEALDGIFEQIGRLPPVDRARLDFNQFAATAVELDVHGDGQKQQVFLTIEFPLGLVRREWTNPLSGERELLIYENGVLKQTVTERRLIELEYDPSNIETRTQTFQNRGTREKPEKGALLEETQTLESWTRDLSQPDTDPYLPLISKLRMNFVTGEISRETYGLFPSPTLTVNDQFLTENKFNSHGIVKSASVLENGRTEEDFQRPQLAKLLDPVRGRERFQLSSTLPSIDNATDLRSENYQSTMQRTDLIKDTVKSIVFDNGRSGRTLNERYLDPFDGTRAFSVVTTQEYNDDLWFGFVPNRTTIRSGVSGTSLSVIQTREYDPDSRRWIGIEVDYTGRTLTNTWDYRWEAPVEIESDQRKTVNDLNRDETSVTGTSISKSTGERISSFSGHYNSGTKTWEVQRNIWYRPEVLLRTETNIQSSFGKLIVSRMGGGLQSHPVYNQDGIEQARQITGRDLNAGAVEVLYRLEDDFRWESGQRDARVQSYAEGQPYDTFRIVTENEGRTIIDGIKELPGLSLRTVVSFEGGTERRTKAETFQSNALRTSQFILPEERQLNGTYLLPVKIVPSWGLSSTNFYRMDDPLGRPVQTVFETGDIAKGNEWFSGTALAKVSELANRHGRTRERWVRQLNAGTESGFAFDLLTRYKVGYWGASAEAERKAVVRGTDIVLFGDGAEERIFYDLKKPYESPRFAIDPRGKFGAKTTINGVSLPQVTGVFRSGFEDRRDPKNVGAPPERMFVLETVDLHGLFYHQFARRVIDRGGNIVEQRFGKIPAPGYRGYSEEAIFSSLDRAAVTGTSFKKLIYRYDPGSFIERTDPKTGEPRITFTTGSAAGWPVNQAGQRELPTEIYASQAASEDQLESTELGRYLFRRIHQRSELKNNPYLPGVSNIWTAWTVTELNASRANLFDSEVIFDAQGLPSTSVAYKKNSSGKAATKIVYKLSSPDAVGWQTQALTQGENVVTLNLGGQLDFSESDFIYLFWENRHPARLRVQVTDAVGRSAIVAGEDSKNGQNTVSFWPVESAQIMWLPDEIIPQHGAVVEAPASWSGERKLLCISVPELVQEGLDPHHFVSASLIVQAAEPGEIKVSPVFHFSRHAPLVRGRKTSKFRYETQGHSSGLETLTRRRTDEKETDRAVSRGWNSLVKFHELPAASVNPRLRGPIFPVAVILDYCDADAPRPLYAVQPETGDFLEYYKTLRWGDAQVYTVVRGFETPKVEISRAGILDDEISPGHLAYGYRYQVSIPLAKASAGLAKTAADLHNRVVASVFKFGGDRLLRLFARSSTTAESLSLFNKELGEAQAQAEDINKLPTLAEAILPFRDVPWAQSRLLASDVLPINTNSLRNQLLSLHVQKYPQPRTGLIPTSLNTEEERFVDTVQEARLIQLAVKLNECTLAAELLDFYWDKSQGGTEALHASYDAETGTSLAKDPAHKRPTEAIRTAEAQLAIAEAALALGTATSDKNALRLGKRLTDLILSGTASTRFRLSETTKGAPRGIAERLLRERKTLYGVTLWPEAETYSLQSNARGYLLFRRLDEMMSRLDSSIFDSDWRLSVKDAIREQEAWLRTNIITQVERSGIVPKGLFQIQDLNHQGTAYGVERWTAAGDWLTFLEAADKMGIPKETTRQWLEHLARVHGVLINGTWGLDWSIALLRPDAISPDLTAKFFRVAKLLEHAPAAEFARSTLSLLRQGQIWPVAVTDPSAQPSQLSLGQGATLYAMTNAQNARGTFPQLWPESLGIHLELMDSSWPTGLRAAKPLEAQPAEQRDLASFFWTAAGFYLAILAVSLFWWARSAVRRLKQARLRAGGARALLVPPAVIQRAEERWAKRVLGASVPLNAERTRFSNGPVEQNFHMQLRAIYKLVLEWRRCENDWSEDDERLVESHSDDWLNGLDEFAAMVGIYSRWVIKAGKKDSSAHADVLQETEDSNHLWARLLMFFSEQHWGLLEVLTEYKAKLQTFERLELNEHIALVLRTMGMGIRNSAFDAREKFNVPANSAALDLLIIQSPERTLSGVVDAMITQLQIPRERILNFLKNYKTFKEREQLYPIHPYVIEAAKLLPHFLLMGLVSLIWYNNQVGGLLIYPYLREMALRFAQQPQSLLWALPLLFGFAFSITAHYFSFYRYKQRMRSLVQPEMWLDSTVTSFFTKTQATLPTIRSSKWWSPLWYERLGWTLRALGFIVLGTTLLYVPEASFATFMFVKCILATLAFVEAGAILAPLALTWLSKTLEDRVSHKTNVWPITRFLNQLNLNATRPASVFWLSIRYHFKPSVPSGGLAAMCQVIAFYFVFTAVFFLVGGYIHKEVLAAWFLETYQKGWNLRLLLGVLLFWNTMYLLRFGLFVLFTAISAGVVTFPLRALCGIGAFLYLSFTLWDSSLADVFSSQPILASTVVALGLTLMAFEEQLLALWRSLPPFQRRRDRAQGKCREAFRQLKADPNRALGVVYMSGDELCYQKLTSDLLISRLAILRDRLDSEGSRLLLTLHSCPDDSTLASWFKTLHETEKKFDVTLWHPLQIAITGQPPRLKSELGLNLTVESEGERDAILKAWHIRRWLVTMMSTAGHAQDTGINLVDIGLRLGKEGLGANTVFYLIQNKYDNHDSNRPSQASYDKGELGQRNKLARLLMEVTPGARAYSINDWTPFGFKAGGLVGMDLVHEESLKLSNMLVLDRNANAHDLDALMEDLTLALTDPGVVIVIPGRSTTNTLTAIGQGSQLVEEGHRAQIKGLMAMGGAAGESVGTGWGNIQAVFYGRVQGALLDPAVPKMPLTSRMRRGSSFTDRFEGLIGFGPHAVGISEDIWGVTQAAHNAIALGTQVKFKRSKTLWHKMRETWSHAEWFSAFPRWSGGYLQMMLDPIMQRINDDGPLSVFAKELRANSGRFFLSAPFALLNILLMPLAIIWNVSPFVQILIVLWNFGLVMNQVLTALGLIAYLECTGFYKIPATAGALLAGSVSMALPGWRPFAPAVIILSFLAGGFVVGLGRWLYDRGRDILLFGPQLVIHALGQGIRQSLEFVLSGAAVNDAKGVNIAFRAWAGPREDRPFETYQSIVNLRSVVWIVGITSLGLDLFALANLDFLNVLLLLPSLLFSVSTLLGPFLLQPKVENRHGWPTWIPKLLGWLSGATFYTVIAWLVAQRGWWEWVGLLIFCGCFALLLKRGLGYFGYARKLRRAARRLQNLLIASGLPEEKAQKLVDQIIRSFMGDLEKTRAALRQSSLAADEQSSIIQSLEKELLPLLRRPAKESEAPRFVSPRFASEWGRSFVLALFTFLWFFIVPVPGLLVLTAGDYRISPNLSSVMLVVAGAITIACAGAVLGRGVERWIYCGLKRKGLKYRIEQGHRLFQTLLRNHGLLTDSEVSSLYALFTDTQTYIDQRSYGYARYSFGLIENILKKASAREAGRF